MSIAAPRASVEASAAEAIVLQCLTARKRGIAAKFCDLDP
jgi:hypothetical protein